MGAAEWKRLNAVDQVEAGELNNREAASVLGISPRQMRRVRARVRKLGRRGAMHGNKGRASARRISEAVRTRVEELGRGKYQGFNDQHFSEKLSEVEGLELARSSVRRILRGRSRSGVQTASGASSAAARAQAAGGPDGAVGRQHA